MGGSAILAGMKEDFQIRRVPSAEIPGYNFDQRVDFKFYGMHKSLNLFFYKSDERGKRVAETMVRNNIFDEHVPGLTTVLYGEAKALIKGVAAYLSEPILYLFETQNSNMKLWAQDSSKGLGLFGWDELFEIGPVLLARKTFLPDGQTVVTEK